MVLQLSVVAETLPTLRTREIELSSVCGFVLQHALLTGKAFLAKVAWILVLSFVRKHMPLIACLCLNHLSTITTHISALKIKANKLGIMQIL